MHKQFLVLGLLALKLILSGCGKGSSRAPSIIDDIIEPSQFEKAFSLENGGFVEFTSSENGLLILGTGQALNVVNLDETSATLPVITEQIVTEADNKIIIDLNLKFKPSNGVKTLSNSNILGARRVVLTFSMQDSKLNINIIIYNKAKGSETSISNIFNIKEL